MTLRSTDDVIDEACYGEAGVDEISRSGQFVLLNRVVRSPRTTDRILQYIAANYADLNDPDTAAAFLSNPRCPTWVRVEIEGVTHHG